MRDLVLKLWANRKWLPSAVWSRLGSHSTDHTRYSHLIIAVADHFEPAINPDDPDGYVNHSEQERRVERWHREYQKAMAPWRDSDGLSFRHTYFYPAEQYDKGLIERLVEHCREGWGEIEIHLHHGRYSPDTAENTRRRLLEFRDALAAYGCLSRWEGQGSPRYAFVHGNWALANSNHGRYCGIDEEMQILAETGCYADVTLPSAPNPAQIGKINSLYECALPLNQRAPHRRGYDLRCGVPPRTFPLIIQGPLCLDFSRRIYGFPAPRIENGALTSRCPPTMQRLGLWYQTAISVLGRPEWIFIKLHCHGMDPRDEVAMIGQPMRQFLRELTEYVGRGGGDQVHFVTIREMVNIVLAACDGLYGDPGDYRNYRLQLISPGNMA